MFSDIKLCRQNAINVKYNYAQANDSTGEGGPLLAWIDPCAVVATSENHELLR